MPLKPVDLPVLSRLLEEARDLGAAEREAWLGALAPEHRPLLPPLRRMLAELEAATPSHPSFLAKGPRLGGQADETSSAQAGEAVGPYRLIRRLGRGGMSAVWLAERPDGIVKRAVALKMPLLTLTSRLEIERFERERDLLAMLAHPQIARLYDAGVTAAGQPFIVLEYIDGLPITEACDSRRLDIPARLRLFLDVLAAVDHAHKHLVVHRDIKPSNVFVDAEGQVKLLDFGVAKLLDEPTGGTGPSLLTRDAGCALTPRYAAPEQLDRRPISTATDVYSLGLLLYELSTGTLPHADRQGSMVEAIEATLHAEPQAPSQALSSMDRPSLGQFAGDLDMVILKALRKDPVDRYGSVEAFSEDLRRLLTDRPIAARPVSLYRRQQLFLRRHRRVAAVAFAGIAAALVLAAATFQQYQRSVAERERADTVRNFMFDLVSGAEPDEKQGKVEVTGRQMVDRAVVRAHDEFKRQPRLQGEILGELGRIYDRLDEAKLATDLYDESLALLDRHAPEDDIARNESRARRAAKALAANDLPMARRLAETASASCDAASVHCAKVRAYASNVMAKLAARAGDTDRAIAMMSSSAGDTGAGFGLRSAEMAMTLLNLAVLQRNAGRYVDAQKTLERAVTASDGQTLRATDRLDLQFTQALLALDLGRIDEARTQFASLVASTQVRGRRLLQLRYLADADLASGDIAAAEVHATAAIEMALDDEKASIRVLFSRLAHARALAMRGSVEGARAEIDAVVEGVRAAGYKSTGSEMLRARRTRAEILARSGDLELAKNELHEITRISTGVAAGLAERALALDLLGAVRRELGDCTAALRDHLEASATFQSALPLRHPTRARNTLYVSAARFCIDASSPSRADLDRAAGEFNRLFAGASYWRAMVDRYVGGASNGETGPTRLLL